MGALKTQGKSKIRVVSVVIRIDGTRVKRIRAVPFSSNSARDSFDYDQVKTSLSESQAEAQATNRWFSITR